MTRRGRRLLALVAGVLVVGVAGAAVATAANRDHDDASTAATGTTTAGSSTAASAPSDTAPWTSSPSDSGTVSSSPAAPSATPSGGGTATPPGREVPVILGYADWDAAGQQVEAAGFVSGTIASGGLCTLTLTSGTATVTATSTAEADATTTNCGALTIPGVQVAPGSWQATLSYQADTAHGTSAPMTVTVPSR